MLLHHLPVLRNGFVVRLLLRLDAQHVLHIERTTTRRLGRSTTSKTHLQGTDELGVAHLDGGAGADPEDERNLRVCDFYEEKKVFLRCFSNSFLQKAIFTTLSFNSCLGLCHPSFHPLGHDLKLYTEEPLDQHLHGTHCTIDHTNSQSKHVTTTKPNVQFY